jgi:hypothetical protein
MHSASLKRITLTLARSKGFPNGSDQIGYELIAPLDRHGHIDISGWKRHRTACTVRHFCASENDKTGMLVHKPGGAEHGRWIFDYDVRSDDDDEAGLLFGRHVFVPGEYVSILDAAGITHTFLIRSVTSFNSLNG